MVRMNLCLFGPGVLTCDGAIVRPHSSKTLALLAYLAIESDRAHSRSKLAGLLWGDRPPAAARQGLRQSLYSLKSLGAGQLAGCFDVECDRLRFTPAPEVDVDVLRFLGATQAADRVAWQCAAALYSAPLLEGHAFDACDEFAGWLDAARERMHALAAQNLDRLTLDAMALGAWDAALAHARSLRALDPAAETAARHLFRIFAARNEPHSIAAEWERLQRHLRTELAIEPSRETAQLCAGLLGKPAQVARVHEAPARTAVVDAIGRAPDEAGAFVRAGCAAERVYAFSQAVDLYDRALRMLRTAAAVDPARCLEALLRKEAALERLGRRAEQVAAIDEALPLAEALGDAGRLATVLLRHAGARTYLGDHAGAGVAAARALELLRALGDRPGQAEALRELGFVHWHAENHVDALRCTREALALHRALGDVAGEASALHNLAEIHRGLGSPREALQWYEQAMRLHWAAGSHAGEILSVFGIAHTLQAIGDTAGATRQYDAALRLATERGERTMLSRALHALALAHAGASDWNASMRFMQRAIEADRSIGYAHALGHDLVDLAGLLLRQGARSEARAALQEAFVWFGLTEEHGAADAVRTSLAELEAGLDPALPTAPRRGVKSHLPLGEGKVYCEFESPLALSAQPQPVSAL